MFFLAPVIRVLNKILDQLKANGRKEEHIEEELDKIVKLLTPSPETSIASFEMSVTPIIGSKG
jgi:hypothetical protein